MASRLRRGPQIMCQRTDLDSEKFIELYETQRDFERLFIHNYFLRKLITLIRLSFTIIRNHHRYMEAKPSHTWNFLQKMSIYSRCLNRRLTLNESKDRSERSQWRKTNSSSGNSWQLLTNVTLLLLLYRVWSDLIWKIWLHNM